MALSTSDPWYQAEEVPHGITVLVDDLRAAFPGAEIGTKGNTVHVKGYHRSRNWVLHSPDCTNRTYSVSETTGNRSGGDGDWICAVDLGLPQPLLLEVCRRLDEAVRAGRLEKITEWYGNLDGDERVDGYNNILNRLATSDSSHLTHLHMSFDRGRANDNHDDLLAILTEDDMDMHTLLTTPVFPYSDPKMSLGTVWLAGYQNTVAGLELARSTAEAVKHVLESVDGLDPAKLAALTAALENAPTAEAIAGAVAVEVHEELGKLHLAQDA